MPLPRRRSSLLGRANVEQTGSTSEQTRGVQVTTPLLGGASGDGSGGPGACLSRRMLGISSVFLQGVRSTSFFPPLPLGDGARQAATHGLNGCLLDYRDKVRALEQLNRKLEEQIRQSLERRASSAATSGALQQEWEELYTQVSESALDNARLMIQTDNVQASAEDLKDRFENEQPFRKAMEEEIEALNKVIEDAGVTRSDLENRIECMKAELEALLQTHEEDVRLLYNQMADHDAGQPEVPIETSLEQILGHIRSHWEKIIEKTRAELDSYEECKVESVSSKLSEAESELESLKLQCNDACSQIQSLQAEIESMKALKRGTENSLSDAKRWHNVELQNLGSVIGKLEAELADVRVDIEQQRQYYETLLGSKATLELEIGTYHGILDAEESRYQPSTCPGATQPEGTHTARPEQQSATLSEGSNEPETIELSHI